LVTASSEGKVHFLIVEGWIWLHGEWHMVIPSTSGKAKRESTYAEKRFPIAKKRTFDYGMSMSAFQAELNNAGNGMDGILSQVLIENDGEALDCLAAGNDGLEHCQLRELHDVQMVRL
jgi:hypothetical protein